MPHPILSTTPFTIEDLPNFIKSLEVDCSTRVIERTVGERIEQIASHDDNHDIVILYKSTHTDEITLVADNRDGEGFADNVYKTIAQYADDPALIAVSSSDSDDSSITLIFPQTVTIEMTNRHALQNVQHHVSSLVGVAAHIPQYFA